MPYAMPCHAMPCPTLPCPVMPCPALPCPAMPCHALPCPALPCAVMARGWAALSLSIPRDIISRTWVGHGQGLGLGLGLGLDTFPHPCRCAQHHKAPHTTTHLCCTCCTFICPPSCRTMLNFRHKHAGASWHGVQVHRVQRPRCAGPQGAEATVWGAMGRRGLTSLASANWRSRSSSTCRKR